jgi:hypothetical protein
MTENKILRFWLIVVVAAAMVAAMSFAMLGFILGGMITMGAGAVVRFADSRAIDGIDKIQAAHEASHIAELGVHEKLN